MEIIALNSNVGLKSRRSTPDVQLPTKGLPLDSAWRYIDSFDYSSILARLTLVDGWRIKPALEAINQYKRFIFLMKKYGSVNTIVPSYEIDEVWHDHILHTENYISFCDKIFGGYLHHRPHILSKNDTYETLKTMFEKTQELHYAEFSEYIYSIKTRGFFEFINRFFRRVFFFRKIRRYTKKYNLNI